MKSEQWLAAFAVVLACGKSAESKQDPKPADKPATKPAEAPAGSTLADGFYRVEAVTLDGKENRLEDAFRKSLQGEGHEVDFVRMTFELAGTKLTVGVEQVFGSAGSATYCSVHGTSEVEVVDGKLHVPLIEAMATSGVVTSKGGETSKDIGKCNVSLKKGIYEVKGTDLSTTSNGKSATMHLVRDDKTIDLKARATAFATRK